MAADPAPTAAMFDPSPWQRLGPKMGFELPIFHHVAPGGKVSERWGCCGGKRGCMGEQLFHYSFQKIKLIHNPSHPLIKYVFAVGEIKSGKLR